jgi:hypothetical protein
MKYQPFYLKRSIKKKYIFFTYIFKEINNLTEFFFY